MVAADPEDTPVAWYRPVERDGATIVAAGGDWTVFALRDLLAADDPLPAGATVVALDLAGLAGLDTAGALELLRLRERLGGCALTGAGATHAQLLEFVGRHVAGPHVPARRGWLREFVEDVGEGFVAFLAQGGKLLAYFGEILSVLAAGLLTPRRLRIDAVVAQMLEVWIRAMPIVGILCFLIGVVTAY